MSLLRTYASFIIPTILFLGMISVVSHTVLDIPFTYAQTGSSTGSGTNSLTLVNPVNVDSVEGLILAVIDVVLIFLIPVIVLYIMYAGFLFVKAQGNPSGISEAKRALVTALIGGVIVLGARAILDVVKGTIDAIRSDAASLDHTPYA